VNGGDLTLIGIDSQVAWGKASTELVKAVYEREAVAIVATDRASSHLAEQVGSKTFVPVIAISGDKTLTSTNVPWIFRVPQDWSLDRVIAEIGAAAKQSGMNRGRLREALVGSGQFTGVGEPVSALR
jgi:hypothetical protein